MIFILNSFSLAMLPPHFLRRDAAGNEPCEARLMVTPVEQPASFLDAFPVDEIMSAVGHADTAALFSALLGRDVPVNRTSVQLLDDDVLLVGQYSGPRLPEGATVLPEGARIDWLAVRYQPGVNEEIRFRGQYYADEVSRLALAPTGER